MKFDTKIVIVGMKKTFGADEKGQKYDKTVVYVQDDLAAGHQGGDWKNETIGMATVAMQAGKSDVFDKLKAHSFPMEALVEIVQEADGKNGVRNRIENIRPSSVPATRKAA